MLLLVPAYGRSYSDPASALSDWEAGKDFKILAGPYTSVRDIELIKRKYDGAAIVWSSEADPILL